jgi:hypothetical protein
MELRVDRHGRDAGVPAREHHLDVRRAVAHRERDAVVRLESCREAGSEPAGARAEFGIARQDARAASQCGPLRVDLRGTDEQLGDVHAHLADCTDRRRDRCADRLVGGASRTGLIQDSD